jgi:hypothetical protein
MIQFVWLTLLAVHTGAAAVWWWLMPGGFPSSSTEYWVNEVAPVVIIVVLLTALFARGGFGHAIRPPVLAALPLFWMAFAISARIVFDESFRSGWSGPFVAAAVVFGVWVSQFRLRLRARWLIPLIVIPAAIAGWDFPGTQRSAEAATTPVGGPLASPPPDAKSDSRMIRLSREAQIRPDDARVVIRRDPLVLNVQPMLTFADRSPDRCWTSLAPEGESRPTVRMLTARVHDASGWTLYYRDEDASVLDVAARDGGIDVDARSRLGHALFSHSNSFAELTIQGHHKLSVSFSPVPQRRVELAPPTAPERFAYLDAGGTFHVMQAADRRRGPFTELGAGAMARDAPLVLTIYDGDKPVFTITFQDWAAQASTQLSPAAGSGIPVNAIELERGGEPEGSPALISLSLAGTTLGRGTESVGHAPGVYRDRIHVAFPR